MERQELENQIWDFVYDLLPAGETAELTERITSDPAVARLYAEIQLQANILARAATLPAPPIELRYPGGMPNEPLLPVAGQVGPQPKSLVFREIAAPTPSPDPHSPFAAAPAARPAAASAAQPASRQTARFVLNSLVSITGAIVLLLICAAYMQPNSPVRRDVARRYELQIEQDQVHTSLLGPTQLQPALTNYFAVRTASADGQPKSVPVSYRMLNARDELLAERKLKTDANGLAQIETPADLPPGEIRLEVATLDELGAPPVQRKLSVGEVELTTHLTTDRPLYRPGDLVRFRSLTLSRFGLHARDEIAVDFRVTSPAGEAIGEPHGPVTTDHGVASGEFSLPSELTSGRYTLVAASPTNTFPEARRAFVVRQFVSPRFNKRLEFARDSFGPGDEVEATFSVEAAAGEKLPQVVLLGVRAEVDEQMIVNQQFSAATDGEFPVRFKLPEQMQNGNGRLTVTVGDGTAEEISKPIPISLGAVAVEWFAESGDMVADVANRVYFRGRNDLNEPVHLRGRVVDDREQVVAKLETQHEGRGRIEFTPRRGEIYRLRIDSPATSQPPIELPPVSASQFATLDAGPGVFDADEDLQVTLRSNQPDRPIGLMAVCRGAVVGQQLVSEGAGGEHKMVLPLAAKAEGVIRVTALDYGVEPPQPIAERLVYRRPTTRLDVRIEPPRTELAFGSEVHVGVEVRDERGAPQAAALGLAVVDDAILNLADDKSPRMTTHFWLLSEIQRPEDLEDANFYLQDGQESAAALDLLLATQGWRRFERHAAPDFSDYAYAGNERARFLARSGAGGRGGFGGQMEWTAAGEPATYFYEYESPAVAAEPLAPVLLGDNADLIARTTGERLGYFLEQQQTNLRRMAATLIVGGCVIVVGLLLMRILRLSAGFKVWAPALACALAGLLVGALWFSGEIASTHTGQIAMTTESLANFGEDAQSAAPLAADGTEFAGAAGGMGGVPLEAAPSNLPTGEGGSPGAWSEELAAANSPTVDQPRAGILGPAAASNFGANATSAPAAAPGPTATPALETQSTDKLPGQLFSMSKSEKMKGPSRKELAESRDGAELPGGPAADDRGANRKAGFAEKRNDRALADTDHSRPSDEPLESFGKTEREAVRTKSDVSAMSRTKALPTASRGKIPPPTAPNAEPAPPPGSLSTPVPPPGPPKAAAVVAEVAKPGSGALEKKQLQPKLDAVASRLAEINSPTSRDPLAAPPAELRQQLLNRETDKPRFAADRAGVRGGGTPASAAGALSAPAAPNDASALALQDTIAGTPAESFGLGANAFDQKDFAKQRMDDFLKRRSPAEDAYFFARQYSRDLAADELLRRRSTSRSLAENPSDDETLAWQPLLIAGPDGRASLTFTLPHRPARFRITADAHTPGRIGSAESILTAIPPLDPAAIPAPAESVPAAPAK